MISCPPTPAFSPSLTVGVKDRAGHFTSWGEAQLNSSFTFRGETQVTSFPLYTSWGETKQPLPGGNLGYFYTIFHNGDPGYIFESTPRLHFVNNEFLFQDISPLLYTSLREIQQYASSCSSLRESQVTSSLK